jgi:transcriptional regulator GlxA family with amidase domain
MTRAVGLLIFPDFQLLDAAGPLAAFEMPMRMLQPAPYALTVLSADGGLVRSSCGVAMDSVALAEAPALDTLIVSGGEGTRGPALDPQVLAFVRAIAGSARRVASVCSGAYVLAAAGLLDGRRATTHWGQCARLQRLFPAVRVEPDRIFVRDGPVWTSAGITAGIDLALALIAEDLGEDVARRAAQQLVVPRRRPGGQTQHAAELDLSPPEGRFVTLIDWMRARLHEPLTVERLADQAAMSPRHFARAFRAETGATPAKAVERLRLEAARARVEDTAEPIDRVAELTGFGDGERMRRAFLRAFGQPPQALRRDHKKNVSAHLHAGAS